MIRPSVIITTHVNADLDGLGAMAGARHLFPGAVLAFPGSQDAAVKDPIVKAMMASLGVRKVRELDLSALEQVVVVDTRSLRRLAPAVQKAIAARDPAVTVIDHHPAGKNDIRAREVMDGSTGSSCSFIALLLRDRGVAPGRDDATLMLVGIYEDTGGLLHGSTTPDDFTAAAWLLGHGADLKTVRSLVVRDMSKEQVRLLNEMLRDLDVERIGGIEVGIAMASADEYQGDFSVLVQKVKDIERLPVIFGIGQLGDRVFVAARSRLPEVDVADILSVVRGGGHAYAASATVKDRTAIEVRELLLSELQRKVRRSRLVSEIMSLPVKWVGPETTVEDAQAALTRYNVNMMPVCEGAGDAARIVGLVSRQNVEKAAYHGFGTSPVRDFMTTEFHSVTPDADIGRVKDLIFSGRQRVLPVVDAAGRPLGIVSRTDFLRIVQEESLGVEHLQSRRQVSRDILAAFDRVMDPLTVERLRAAGAEAVRRGWHAYLVGGVVRDLVMGRSNLDIDIVIEGDGIALARSLAGPLEARVSEHPKFGTAHLQFGDGRKIDVASARIEYYPSPAALPEVEKGSLKLDLYRRDFTINTLSVRLDEGSFGELVDFFGGLRDIKDGVIRVLHNLSFVEDPTRAFRAARFAARFGFKISKHTQYLIRNAARMNMFDLLAGPRLFAELELILDEPDPPEVFEIIDTLQLSPFVCPGFSWTEARQLMTRAKEVTAWYDMLYTGVPLRRDVVYYLCMTDSLSDASFDELAKRYGLCGEFLRKTQEGRAQVRDLLRSLPRCRDDAECFFLLRPHGHETILYVLARMADGQGRRAVAAYLTSTWKERTIITGDDLIALGVKPSRQMKDLLDAVLRARLSGAVRTRDDELAFVRNALNES